VTDDDDDDDDDDDGRLYNLIKQLFRDGNLKNAFVCTCTYLSLVQSKFRAA
jgi:hypothetical protein